MWVRRRANVSRHETVHTVLGVRFDFSAPSRTPCAENGLSLLARLGRSAVDPCWQAHTHFLIAEPEFLYAIWNPASQYEIVDSRLSRHWVWAQLGRVPLLDTAGLALKTSQITEGIYMSAYLGREVTADEIENEPASVRQAGIPLSIRPVVKSDA